jgi:hypothetical protein
MNVNPFISSGLLAASMVLGQTGEPPAAIQQAQAQTPAPGQQPSRPIFGWFTREDRPVMSRIQGWFKRDSKDGAKDSPTSPPKDAVIRETVVPATVQPKPSTPSNDFPRRMPQPQSQGTMPRESFAQGNSTDIQQATLKQVALPSNAKNPILPQFADKIGRDEKFEWITGQIEIEDGKHVLYYSVPEVIDQFHGRIFLAPEKVDLTKFKKGDLISVRGQLLQRQTAQGIVPIYRLSEANLIERPKQ